MGHQQFDEEMTFEEMRCHFRKPDGRMMSRQGVQSFHAKTLDKVRFLLLRDPVVREWLMEKGLLENE